MWHCAFERVRVLPHLVSTATLSESAFECGSTVYAVYDQV